MVDNYRIVSSQSFCIYCRRPIKIFQETTRQACPECLEQVLDYHTNDSSDLTVLERLAGYDINFQYTFDALGHIVYLDLDNCGLIEFPEIICSLKYLKKLSLVSHELYSVPDSISQLQSLEELDIHWNETLTVLPPTIGNLKNLQILDLRLNNLHTIPLELHNLMNLKKLDLSWNYLTEFPSIPNNLLELDLGRNQISDLPDSLIDLSHLETFILYKNKLESLPETLAHLHELKVLDLRWNKLTCVPTTIGSLYNLTLLDLSWNKLTSLPEEIHYLSNLRELRLWGNKLSYLLDINRLPNLKGLFMRGNPLPLVPEATLTELRSRKASFDF